MPNKKIVRQYLEGFRTGNASLVLECLADDVVWRLHGCQTFEGKSVFAANISNDEFTEIPKLEIRDLIEEGDRVVAVGSGAVEESPGKKREFTFCEIFVFCGGLVSQVDTFHVWSD